MIALKWPVHHNNNAFISYRSTPRDMYTFNAIQCIMFEIESFEVKMAHRPTVKFV